MHSLIYWHFNIHTQTGWATPKRSLCVLCWIRLLEKTRECFNIKISMARCKTAVPPVLAMELLQSGTKPSIWSYQYRISRYKCKTVSRPSSLIVWIPVLGKTVLYCSRPMDPDWVEQSTAMSPMITNGYLLVYVLLDTATYWRSLAWLYRLVSK